MATFVTIAVSCLLVLSVGIGAEENSSNESESQEEWTGKWFPSNPNKENNATSGGVSANEIAGNATTSRVLMGVVDNKCDDGKTNLTVDDSGTGHLCLANRTLFKPNNETLASVHLYNIPERYSALHKCMNEEIDYDYPIPTFGTHRALWPKYGEYSYVPVQRWLHNLEHGAVVFLYHPCANKMQIDKLRTIVTSCLYRYVITPSERLGADRPFALVAWGSILQMSVVQKDLAVDFIKTHALNGPEHTSNNGQFDNKLLEPAKVVSTQNDDQLCPDYIFF